MCARETHFSCTALSYVGSVCFYNYNVFPWMLPQYASLCASWHPAVQVGTICLIDVPAMPRMALQSLLLALEKLGCYISMAIR